jgi:hypothetical protein
MCYFGFYVNHGNAREKLQKPLTLKIMKKPKEHGRKGLEWNREQ